MSELLKDLNIEPKYHYFGVEVDEDLHDELQLLWPDHTWVSTYMIGVRFRKYFGMIGRAQPHIAFGVLISCMEWLARTRQEWHKPMVRALRLYADRIEQGRMPPKTADNRRPGYPAGMVIGDIQANAYRGKGDE